MRPYMESFWKENIRVRPSASSPPSSGNRSARGSRSVLISHLTGSRLPCSHKQLFLLPHNKMHPAMNDTKVAILCSQRMRTSHAVNTSRNLLLQASTCIILLYDCSVSYFLVCIHGEPATRGTDRRQADRDKKRQTDKQARTKLTKANYFSLVIPVNSQRVTSRTHDK